jgi:hypothetical protein
MIRSNRARRATLKARVTATRAAARIHRNGVGTLASHCMAQGLSHRDAGSVAGTLRKLAAKIGVAGTPGRIHAPPGRPHLPDLPAPQAGLQGRRRQARPRRMTAEPLPGWEETAEEVAAWDRWWGDRDTDTDNDQGGE